MKFWSTLLLALVPGALAADTFATFNIRYDNSGDAKAGNGWERRLPVISEIIHFHAFDVFGTQEGLPHQMKGLREALTEYEVVSYGREDGQKAGENVAIFYRKGSYELLEEGRFWLSDTPDQPGKGWDAALPRICTWAKLRDIKAEREFFFFNIHFDHRGGEARLESAKLMLKKAAEIAGDSPVVMVGDFNAAQDSEPYRLLDQSEKVSDAYRLAPIRMARVGTINKFDPTAATQSRIDHLFVSEEFQVNRFGILSDSYRSTDEMEVSEGTSDGNFPKEVRFHQSQARLPSDHFPVVAIVEWAE
ncbi:endonuclease/exonuclease/phosphatase family protein [Roseibacillus ishigakijimensis]|uniref:Endonuclease/exonuclease/phosphatase family protein n=1 Tax=Roseibacillus ishigakijimensis TaxID=454146 RepID=A0A934RS95_9BACT|nr:endonuclease/exonuclease/phosphatase family protein [Roseibacillus ishigakijimensis]MBK1833586.1 endonuclease/exonuclease/phosphatase family protein [Roseibacillus ishigakijimensis]